MPIATAAAFRKEVFVDVPGTDLQIKCRRPDLFTQIAHGVLSQALVQEAMKAFQDGKFDMATAAPDTVQHYAEFVDRWVCLAALEPRIVLTREETVSVPDAVWIDDLEYDLKIAIVAQTMGKAARQAVAPEVAEFRRDEPAGAGAGPDGAEVRH